MRSTKMGLTYQWVVYNGTAMICGYLVYTPIAHGVTGAHGRDLTSAQLLAHSIALAVVGIAVAAAQHHVLARLTTVTWKRVPVVPVAFISAFWIGYYQPYAIGPDTDMILGFFVLGSAMWIGIIPASGHRVAATIAMASFPLAGVVGQLLLVIAIELTQFSFNPRTSMLHHTSLWLITGGVAGLLGGLVSGLALSRMLPARDRLSQGAAQQQLPADAASPRG